MKLENAGDAYRDGDERQGASYGPSVTRRFTVFVSFPGGELEEIDVDSASRTGAEAVALAALDRDYIAGGKIIGIEERYGLYI